MNQNNLICYIVIDKQKANVVELRTHNPGSKDANGNPFKGANFFNNIGINAGTRYDLTKHEDLLAFDSLIQTISNI